MSISSMVVGLIICFGLFFAVIGGSITSLGGTYDDSTVNMSELDSYNHLDSLASRIKGNATSIEGASVDSGAFDWFAGLWSKIKTPFVFVTQSYKTLVTVTEQASSKFQLMPAFKAALTTIIIFLVVFGLLAARYYLGRR